MRTHFYNSLIAGLLAFVLCGVLLLTPFGWWTVAISVGIGVFLVSLYLNPKRRFFRLAVNLMSAGGLTRAWIPQRIEWRTEHNWVNAINESCVPELLVLFGGLCLCLDFYQENFSHDGQGSPVPPEDTPSGPPHDFFVWFLGRWSFSRWDDRTSFNESSAKGTRWNPVDVPLSEVRPLHNMPDSMSQDRFLVIHGPAGVGKSVHASLLALKFAEKYNLHETGLILRVSCENFHQPFETVWELACDALRAANYQIPKHAIAYALSQRPLLILIEDAHIWGAAAEQSLRKLRDKLLATRTKMSTCSIIVTTRLERKSQLIDNADHRELYPLSPADSLFLLQELIGDSKSRLENELPPVSEIKILDKSETRTPLFIGLAASLIKDQPERMLEVFQFRETELIDNYIEKLFEKSCFNPRISEHTIRHSVRQLAYEAFPNAQVSPSSILESSSHSLEELEQHGFLVKPTAISNAFSFPHTSIANRLAVGLMSERGNYAKLRGLSDESLQPLMSFIEYEAKSEAQFLSLAESVFDLSVQLYGRRTIVLTTEVMTSFVNIAAQKTEDKRFPLTAWEPFFVIVYKRPNREELLSVFCRGVRRTANGVSALCHLRSKESKELLKEWLCRDDLVDVVRDAAFNDPEVESQLFALLEEQQKLSRIAVSIVAVLAARVNNRERLVHWFKDHGRKPTRSWSRMIQIGSGSEKVLVLAACDWHEELRRKVVAILCSIRKDALDVLIPSGLYSVHAQNGVEKMVITAPYVLRREPVKKFIGTFQCKAMRERIPKGHTPPSRSQLLVAHELAESSSNKKHVTFYKGAYEIVDNGSPGLIGVTSDGRVDSVYPTESTNTVDVCYRTVKMLQLDEE